MIVKDAMVLIHLAKMSILRKSCEYFKQVLIPTEVYEEIMKGKDSEHYDLKIIEEEIKVKRIAVEEVVNKDLIKKVNNFNVYGGEAEAVALYWEKDAEYLASDDNNIRKKKELFELNIIGTPAIVVALYRKGSIGEEKYLKSIDLLKKIGWFSSSVIDMMKMEVKNG